jgi:hypothetical protein
MTLLEHHRVEFKLAGACGHQGMESMNRVSALLEDGLTGLWLATALLIHVG